MLRVLDIGLTMVAVFLAMMWGDKSTLHSVLLVFAIAAAIMCAHVRGFFDGLK